MRLGGEGSRDSPRQPPLCSAGALLAAQMLQATNTNSCPKAQGLRPVHTHTPVLDDLFPALRGGCCPQAADPGDGAALLWPPQVLTVKGVPWLLFRISGQVTLSFL